MLLSPGLQGACCGGGCAVVVCGDVGVSGGRRPRSDIGLAGLRRRAELRWVEDDGRGTGGEGGVFAAAVVFDGLLLGGVRVVC